MVHDYVQACNGVKLPLYWKADAVVTYNGAVLKWRHGDASTANASDVMKSYLEAVAK
jgi:hypothetical protein